MNDMISKEGKLSVLFLKFADLILLLAALGTSVLIYHAPHDTNSITYPLDFLSTRVKLSNVILCSLLLITWHFSFKLNGLYLSYRMSNVEKILRRVGKVVAICSAILLIAAQFNPWRTINLWTLSGFYIFGILFVGGYRTLTFYVSGRFRRRGINTKSLIILGGGFRSENFVRKIERSKERGYRILGYLESDPEFCQNTLAGKPWLGRFESLKEIINREVVDEVVIALPIKSQYKRIKRAIGELEEQGVVVHILSDFFPQHLARIQPQEFQGFPLLTMYSAPVFHWRTELKRLIDIFISATLLVLLAPVFIVLAILIKLDSPGPVFFTQQRMGYNKRRFQMVKFRTMVADAEAKMKEIEHLNEKDGAIFKISNDPRITRTGKYLRKLSLDEFPQLFNVLLGDMSLVGPRPLSIRDALRLEEDWQKRRFSIRPGMTCLWQISGRSNLSFEEWMELDLKYIDSWSLNLDWWILLKTIPAVLTARGAV
jgi:exopolysaccharide biosynthesis polyprenyl glycosylphosphotransferase